MEKSQDLNRKTLKKCRKMVDVQKVMEIVEGGSNTQEINAAFDYDLVSSDDDSSNSGIISSEESENSIDYCRGAMDNKGSLVLLVVDMVY